MPNHSGFSRKKQAALFFIPSAACHISVYERTPKEYQQERRNT